MPVVPPQNPSRRCPDLLGSLQLALLDSRLERSQFLLHPLPGQLAQAALVLFAFLAVHHEHSHPGLAARHFLYPRPGTTAFSVAVIPAGHSCHWPALRLRRCSHRSAGDSGVASPPDNPAAPGAVAPDCSASPYPGLHQHHPLQLEPLLQIIDHFSHRRLVQTVAGEDVMSNGQPSIITTPTESGGGAACHPGCNRTEPTPSAPGLQNTSR